MTMKFQKSSQALTVAIEAHGAKIRTRMMNPITDTKQQHIEVIFQYFGQNHLLLKIQLHLKRARLRKILRKITMKSVKYLPKLQREFAIFILNMLKVVAAYAISVKRKLPKIIFVSVLIQIMMKYLFYFINFKFLFNQRVYYLNLFKVFSFFSTVVSHGVFFPKWCIF